MFDVEFLIEIPAGFQPKSILDRKENYS